MTVPARVPGSAPRPPDVPHPHGDLPPAPSARVEVDIDDIRRSRPSDGSRAVLPDAAGYVERDGTRIWWEAFGSGSPTIMLLPTWSIIHSRCWKAQIAYLSRRYRVVTFDGRGNGRSDRPSDAAAYAVDEYAADALAVLDATGTRDAVQVSLSMGAQWSLLLAAHHPERVTGAVFIGPAVPLAEPDPARAARIGDFDARHETSEGWNKYNRHYWRRDYRGFLEFFFSECLPEPHSTKPTEDCVRWGLDTDPETLILTEVAPTLGDREQIAPIARSVRCPVLVIHGSDDHIIRHAHGAALAALTGGRLLTFEGSGHLVQAREPVRTNLAIRDFVDGLPGVAR